MNILFLSRKRPRDTGGLARFIRELIARFPAIDWRQSVDLIHMTDATLLPFGVLLKFLLRTTLTVTAHGKDISWPNPIYQHIFSRCVPHVDAWVVDSSAALPMLKRKGVTNIRVIPPGISVDQFKKQIPGSFSVPAHAITLATVGNLVARKGHAWFIREVLTKLPRRYLYLIVGDGKEGEALTQLSARLHLGDRIFLLGRLSDRELAGLYPRIDIYIAPNIPIPDDFEGFGIAAGEASAMGLPVIAHRVDGLPSVIHDKKNGVLIPPTLKAWRNALQTLTLERRNALGKRAKRYTLARFSWNRTVRAYRRLFREVTDKT